MMLRHAPRSRRSRRRGSAPPQRRTPRRGRRRSRRTAGRLQGTSPRARRSRADHVRTLLADARIDACDGFVGIVGDHDEVHVGGEDHAFLDEPLSPVEERLPVFAPEEDHGEVADLPGLHQRQRLEELVVRSPTARQDDERLRRLHEADLARVEVAELVGEIEPRIEPLFHRELDPEADGEASGFLGAAVGRLHQAGPAARDDGEVPAGETSSESHRAPVPRIVVRQSSRSEHRHSGSVDAVDDLEAGAELLPHEVEGLLPVVVPADPERLFCPVRLLGFHDVRNSPTGTLSRSCGIGPRSKAGSGHPPNGPHGRVRGGGERITLRRVVTFVVEAYLSKSHRLLWRATRAERSDAYWLALRAEADPRLEVKVVEIRGDSNDLRSTPPATVRTPVTGVIPLAT